MNVSLKCRCGAFQGIARGVSRDTGIRCSCLCDDCQAYAHFLGRAEDVLDANGGTDVFPVTPARLEITRGAENLRCLRLSAKGMFRWYAGCCKTPIANSMPHAGVPFAGVIHTIMDHKGDHTTRDEALGPIQARIYGKYGVGQLPPGTYQTGPTWLILRTVRFLAVAFLRGERKPSPFFDGKTGKPIVEPYVLSATEREALRAQCGPKP